MRSVQQLGKTGLFFAIVWILSTVSSCAPSELTAPGMGVLDPMGGLGALQLAGVTPGLGPTIGGTRVSLSGQNFADGATVTIAGVAAMDVTVWSGTLITATLPRNLGTLGKVSVVVQNPDGQKVSRSDLFAYHLGQLPFPEPILSSMGVPIMAATVGDFNGDQQTDIVAVGPNGAIPWLSNGLGGFDQTTFFRTGLNPSAVVVGDFNADQRLDIATANSGSGDVSVLLGNGSGGFSPSVNIGPGTSPTALAVGDWNGDRKLDLVVVSRGNSTLSVLIGDGFGGFGAPTTYATGMRPTAVTVGDWNGDHKLDLAVTILTTASVSVLLGDGMGGFGAIRSFAVGTSPNAVSVEDFNRDGKPDLAVANMGSNNVSVLLGDGSGGFSTATNFAAGTAPSSLAVSDFNGDTNVDLGVASPGSPSLNVLLGDGTGGFAVAQNRLLNQVPTSLMAADLNGDAKPDLAIIGTASIRLLLNDALGGFRVGSVNTRCAYPYYDNGPPNFAVADVNGDQKLDLVAPIGPTPGVRVALGDGNGAFSTVSDIAGPALFQVVVGDWNGDQKPDLVGVNDVSQSVIVRLGDGSGGFGPVINIGISACSPSAIAVGDFNQDGNSDLAVGCLNSSVVILSGDGKGGFVAANPVAFKGTISAYPQALVTGDFNGDQLLDLIVVGWDGYLHWFKGDAKGGLIQQTSVRAITGQSVRLFPAIGDFNGDHLPDLAVSHPDAATSAKVFLGNPVAGLGSGTSVGFSTSYQGAGVSVGDFNGDQNLDLAIAAIDLLGVYWGNGLGSFTGVTNFPPMGCWTQAGDFNGDAKLDLVYTDGLSRRVLLNVNQ